MQIEHRHAGARDTSRDTARDAVPAPRGPSSRPHAVSTQAGGAHTGNHTPDPTSDAALLALCRSGDAEAWDRLVARYERLIFSVALRNGLGREDAADVTQATFVALLDSIDLVREEDRLASWLMTVARRHAWRVRRSLDREQPWAATEAGHDPIADWERAAVLHTALDQLGAPCRDLLDALYFDASSPSYAVVAARMGRAVGSLGPLRGRCLARLRAILGEDH